MKIFFHVTVVTIDISGEFILTKSGLHMNSLGKNKQNK